MKNKKSEYVVFVNTDENFRKALDEGFEEVKLISIYNFTDKDLKKYSVSKVIAFIMDAKYEDDEAFHAFSSKIRERNKAAVYYVDEELYDEPFPNKDSVEKSLIGRGLIHETNVEAYCGNCHKPIDSDDIYCPYCGTKKGKGKFEPFYNPVYCVYGPPTIIHYQCDKCGHSWKSVSLSRNDEYYCPKCGAKKVKKTKVEEGWDFFDNENDE